MSATSGSRGQSLVEKIANDTPADNRDLPDSLALTVVSSPQEGHTMAVT